MSNSHSASSNSHSASNSEPVYFQWARVVFLEPGEVIVVASRTSAGARVVHAPPSTLYEVPQDVEPGFTFIATQATPPPSPMLSSASSLESEVPESQVPVQLPATRSTQQVSPSDNPPTTDPLTPTLSALSTSHAAYTRADAPPPYVAQIQQPLPEGLVKVYAAWNSHVPTPVEILTYWPRALYEKCYIVLEGCRIGIFPTWPIAKPFVERVSGARFQSLRFSKALEMYRDCYNRVLPHRYPFIHPVPSGADCSVINFRDHTLSDHDIEIAMDNMGHMFTFAMGSPESALLR
ncbi:hypothetical protein D9758_010881 [Tetrapyrgos nigripes]|uniref:Uncharacterized protein n=1 Tax=Tetrapyrgos nigripes TaxID=182062 RepID=A0A8H5GI04_9AGAR|nr:hypothetical protein D9758_010881 [Tetrapyrgos nigripes]